MKQVNKSLKKHHRYIYWVSDWLGKIQRPRPIRPPNKFETLVVQVLSLKTKNKIKYFQPLQKKSNFYFPKKQSMFPLDKGLQWVNVKQQPYRNVGTFRHSQTYQGIIQAYSGILKTLCYPDIFCDWYIQNPNTFRTRSIFRTLPHIFDEPLIIFTAIIIFTNYNYFRKACRIEINILRQLLQSQLCSVKNYGARGARGP